MRPGAALGLGALLFVAACTTPAPAPRLAFAPISVAALPGWGADRVVDALPAFARSCAARAKAPDAAAWRAVCAAASRMKPPTEAAARQFFATQFTAYTVRYDGASTGLFTGYFEPELDGARAPGGRFTTPLLRRPPDLVSVDLGAFRPAWRGRHLAGRVVDGRLTPYPSRAEIERGALDAQHLAFLWVDDPVAAFFVQIQGSGRVRLADGSTVRVGYDGDNGWPYVAIGRLLVARRALAPEAVSLATIRVWLAAHPGQRRALMDENPSYVFFRPLSGDGPIGSEGVALTPGRSLAVDPAFIPLGAPLWLDAVQAQAPLRRLVVAQDTGAAIRGAIRGDLFWGAGAAAEARAGGMRARGSYVILLPRGVAPPGR